jgi:hypothetical protein
LRYRFVHTRDAEQVQHLYWCAVPAVCQPRRLSQAAARSRYNNLTLTIETWAPTLLAERFGLSPVQIGTLLAAPQSIRTFGGFGVAALESALLRQGVPVLTLRRRMTALAQLPEAACAVGYGLAQSASTAGLCYAGFVAFGLLNYSGAWANEIEVHGCDAAIIGEPC